MINRTTVNRGSDVMMTKLVGFVRVPVNNFAKRLEKKHMQINLSFRKLDNMLLELDVLIIRV